MDNKYPLAPPPLSDSIVGQVRPRARTGRHDAQVAAPVRVAPSRKNPLRPHYDRIKAEGDVSSYLTCDSVSTTKLRAEERRPSPQGKRKLKPVDTSLRRREQCRANQARYRARQRNAQDELEKTVDQLHAEVDTLKRRCRDLTIHERNSHSPWVIVAEVLQLLESSFRSPWQTSPDVEMDRKTRQTLVTLEKSFAHDAAMGGLCGVDALMEQFQLYSQSFGDTRLNLHRIESVAPGVMTARATLSVTVTEATLKQIFPHLDGAKATKPLRQKLLGQRLVLKGSMTFLFDEDSERVVRLDTKIDLVTPLLEILGNLRDVEVVLHRARISPECCIVGAKVHNCL
ncbi:bZIP transcription factor 1 [Phytophthora citrophthora]|uniref:BZIP transcription factor 1 n=1 Tax=Phytophthora citrophthora TaxID=4793 RepID=A0AAD9G937_9STRA|nr:bZIP transcription factor 1 [Phytophthora citrophthora]